MTGNVSQYFSHSTSEALQHEYKTLLKEIYKNKTCKRDKKEYENINYLFYWCCLIIMISTEETPMLDLHLREKPVVHFK